jgi:hypothetical protein
MNEQQVRAIFLLAAIPVVSLKMVDNGYWPDGPEFKERREQEPWWIVNTGHGEIEIGARKRVIDIEWCNTGLVFPFVPYDDIVPPHYRHIMRDPNVTTWETGSHAWGYGEAVSVLTALRKCFDTHDFLKKYWAEHPVQEADKKDWLIVGRKAHWASSIVDRVEVTISAANPTFALQEFYVKYPLHRKILLGEEKEIMSMRKRMELCE